MSDWEEIKRLAADFQKIQLTTTTQRLSERNCIEIITMLIEKKLIDLIYTSDGKEYLTPTHLVTEMRNELYVNEGRVNLTDLSQSIGVDLHHITAHVGSVLKGQREIIHILGQLIDMTYIVRIAGEINEKLMQQGQINVNDLTMQYDLPGDFIQQQIMEKHLGKIIIGQQDKNDPRIFFTESFIAHTKAKIRGALIGLTKPTPITAILSNLDISEKLFHSLFNQTITCGSISGRSSGAQYIPYIYLRSQTEWVNNFYKQNGYLEYESLSRVGIVDYKTYFKKNATFDKITYLDSCAISLSILERITADIDECITSKSFLDLQTNLPSIFNDRDIDGLLEKVLISNKHKECVRIDNYLLSRPFVDGLINDCDDLIKEKAQNVVESGKYQQYQTDLQMDAKASGKPMRGEGEDVKNNENKRDERRKKATSGKSGGGTQGRETKTKSTKNKYRNRTNIDVDDDDFNDDNDERKMVTLELINLSEISNAIQIVLETEGIDDLIDSIVQHLHPILNEKSLGHANDIYMTTVSDRTAVRRQTHNDVQNKLNALASDIRLFEKGIKVLPLELQSNLYKYLLKTHCNDFLNELLSYVSAEKGLNQSIDQFSNEQRAKFLNDLPREYKMALQTLLKSLSSTASNLDEFFDAIEPALNTCSMIIKKIDKKKDRLLILNHKHALLEQLEKCDDPPLVLHLVTLILFISATQSIVHASGRHVSQLLTYLKQFLTNEQIIELIGYHDMVLLVLGAGATSDVETAKERLVDKMLTIKQIAIDFKKTNIDKVC